MDNSFTMTLDTVIITQA